MPTTNELEKLLAKQPCKTCRANRNIKPCPGHALGNDAGNDYDDDALRTKTTAEYSHGKTGSKSPQLRPDTTDLKKWLDIAYDKESGIFALKLNDPRFTSEQKENFAQKLLSAWKEFRHIHNLIDPIHDPRIVKDALGNVTITLLVPGKLFGLLLQHLVSNQLLSKERADYYLKQQQTFATHRPTLSTLTTPLQRAMNPFRTPKLEVK